MSAATLPAPEEVQNILIWHQGALGDLLLASPALLALRRRYPRARLTALGHPGRWGLLSRTLGLAAVWDSGAAAWLPLFSAAPLPPVLKERLAAFQLALVFSPGPQAGLLENLGRAGVSRVCWLPSFADAVGEPVAVLQARRLASLGLAYEPRPFRLNGLAQEAGPAISGPGPWLAVAPGSGHPRKNWPLSHYYEAARTLAWEHKMQVVWLTGPAEAAMLPFIQGLAAAQGHRVVDCQPLARVAAVLAQCRLYLGNDSGLTHLAAAAGTGGVVGLFGPTDPAVWAPPGRRVTILAGSCPQAPCARGREIPCGEPRCLRELSPEQVIAAAAARLAG